LRMARLQLQTSHFELQMPHFMFRMPYFECRTAHSLCHQRLLGLRWATGRGSDRMGADLSL
jgi:hypothetical protein